LEDDLLGNEDTAGRWEYSLSGLRGDSLVNLGDIILILKLLNEQSVATLAN
jgi:hypothetical protein